MNDNTIYRPEKFARIFLFFFPLASITFFLLAGHALPCQVGAFSFFLLSGILSVWETKVMYDFSQKAIVFEKDGVRIIGGSYKEYRYMPLTEISYACYDRDYKGGACLVLSQEVLTAKEIRHIVVWTVGVKIRYSFDGGVVMPIDNTQDLTQIKAWIKENINVSGPDYFADGR